MAFGIDGVAAGFAGSGIDMGNDNINNYNSVTSESPVMCVGHLCRYPGFDSLSPVVQDKLMRVIGEALASGAADSAGGGGMPAAASMPGGGPTTALIGRPLSQKGQVYDRD
ncbi:hypothetical protein CYMTET_31428 [Cymbomonas tetramitiformis]|uniref:Uncharacterized protein n=1 Tax=Cymbomonas tetramitiformis TaxID=36881 RepID=A0AAE0FH52_9CHLO|nr:hypothetical protein CYMTET_31428 [Cymbomonas tetramitiformis]